MLGVSILFEPLPVGRIGVRLDDDEVVVANDFSTFGWMIEEFVALGVTTIVIARSAPESRLLQQMPPLLRRRIRIVDDTAELQATALIMEPINDEAGCRVLGGGITFSRKIRPQLRAAVTRVHHDLYALSVGLNHKTQVAINHTMLADALDQLRQSLRDDRARSVASQLSGVIAAYHSIRFEGPKVAAATPTQIISLFDQLVNDESYVGFSNSVASLANTAGRRAALSRVRSNVRRLVASPPVQAIVDTVSKLVKVGSAGALPNASSLFSMFQLRAMPILVDVSSARSKALRRWLSMGPSTPPLTRDGRQLTTGGIQWLPPLRSASAGEPGDAVVSMGKARDLLESLISFDRARRSR